MVYNDFENNLTEVFCPMIDEIIEDIDCMENRACIDGEMQLSSLPAKYKTKQEFINICRQCKYHNY